MMGSARSRKTVIIPAICAIAFQPISPQLVGYSRIDSRIGLGVDPTVRYCVSITISAGRRPNPAGWPKPAMRYTVASASVTMSRHGGGGASRSLSESVMALLKIQPENGVVVVQGPGVSLEDVAAVTQHIYLLRRRHHQPEILLDQKDGLTLCVERPDHAHEVVDHARCKAHRGLVEH